MPPGARWTSPLNYRGPESLSMVTYLFNLFGICDRCVYSLCLLFKTTESQHCGLSAVRTTEQMCGQAVTCSAWTCFRTLELRSNFTSPDFGASIRKLEKNKLKKKNHKPKRENPYTSCFQERTQCACKATKQKGKKKSRKKKEKTEKLSICSENQRRLPHWLFPFVILIVLMTPKIPKIPFSVRSAFCLCSFMIWTLLSDIWYVQPQLRHPKETMMYAKGAVTLERDIFCVSGLCLLPPPPPPPPTCSGCKSGCCCHWIL